MLGVKGRIYFFIIIKTGMEKKFTKYDELDFAEDPFFIRWVQGKDQKATAFWTKWISKNPGKEADIKAAKSIVQSIQIKEREPSEKQIKNLWDKIDSATATEEKETAVIRSIGRRKWIGYAAAACIGLVAFFTFYNPTTTVDIGAGEHLAYTLPDNSTIDLNADSKITFKAGDFDGDRIVNLEGEAFFEVKKGQSFKVITPNGTIEVLGTSFNVNTRNGNLVVDCSTGKVRVTAKGSEQILTKGLGTKLNKEQSALEDVYPTNITQQTGWRNGDFYLVNTAFDQAIEEMERQFDVTIDCEASLKQRIGDYTFKRDDLEKALEDVLYQLNAEYTISGNKVTIKTK